MGPVVVGLAATYHPQWHVCIVPGTVTPSPWTCWLHGYAAADTHISPLGFANGWVIDRRGPYTVVIDYEFQHVADLLQILSVLMVAGAVAAWAVQSLPDRYRRWMPIKGRGKALARREVTVQADADEVRV